jgi:hypothetical protein
MGEGFHPAVVIVGPLTQDLFADGADHRLGDRWKSKQLAGAEREERVQGKETVGFVPLLSSRIRTAEKVRHRSEPSWLSKFQICLGRSRTWRVSSTPISSVWDVLQGNIPMLLGRVDVTLGLEHAQGGD